MRSLHRIFEPERNPPQKITNTIAKGRERKQGNGYVELKDKSQTHSSVTNNLMLLIWLHKPYRFLAYRVNIPSRQRLKRYIPTVRLTFLSDLCATQVF